MSSGGTSGPRAPEPLLRLKCNLRVEMTGTFVDLNGGGGQDPPVIGQNDNNWETNPNQHWELYTLPGRGDDEILIKSVVSGGYLLSDGHATKIRCERVNIWDENVRWHIEGMDWGNFNSDTHIRFRNHKHSNSYLDLANGHKENRTPMMTWDRHGGSNQVFKLWRR
ncbi:hypothetical protein G7Z17_g2361 [Cylindrodendrum hubeiense]|uniref:Ricin B lectin domain-containing protein n=1 Tax=Cylindrodendrum hubeiense TaxID=595255 RepID=A0A9P5LEH5_9HYPO|nr:hypothetical protein G7Z17_g2361 [Cylindrodendrum hubeiense]